LEFWQIEFKKVRKNREKIGEKYEMDFKLESDKMEKIQKKWKMLKNREDGETRCHQVIKYIAAVKIFHIWDPNFGCNTI
jgi:alkyl hydroperoxide reductase subunit AhpC